MHPIFTFWLPFFIAFWWNQDNLLMLRLPATCGSSFIGPPAPTFNLLALQQLHDTISLSIICIMISLQCTWMGTSTIPFPVHTSLFTTCSLPCFYTSIHSIALDTCCSFGLSICIGYVPYNLLVITISNEWQRFFWSMYLINFHWTMNGQGGEGEYTSWHSILSHLYPFFSLSHRRPDLSEG